MREPIPDAAPRRTLALALAAALLAAHALAACGSSGKKQVEEPGAGDDDSADTGGDSGDTGDSGLIPEEKFQEIDSVFNAKIPTVSRCYDEASAPKGGGMKGHVTIGVTIETDGHPTGVKVLETDFTSKKVGDCIVDMVKGWTFPTLPRSLDTSHIYVLDKL